jgi:RNA-directed DNA polymerase
MGQAPSGFPRASNPADQEPTTHVEVGTGHEHGPELRLRHHQPNLQSACLLATCDLASQTLPRASNPAGQEPATHVGVGPGHEHEPGATRSTSVDPPFRVLACQRAPSLSQYGFRPGRSPHHALDALAAGIVGKNVNWVLDADFSDYFSSLDHQWLMKFLEHRIADRRVLRLIEKWLAAGVIEDGSWTAIDGGVPQGASASPLLANVYAHYVLDLWVHQWRTRHAHGDVIIVRWADDFVVGFEHREDAERFWAELRDRLAKFGLELHAEKTRLIEFGRHAARDRAARGLGKPETFQFLGFTHVCGKTRKTKRFKLTRLTDAKRMRAKLLAIKRELWKRMHHPIPEQGRWLARVLAGHYNYYAVPDNIEALSAFRYLLIRHWLRSLRRRSQKHRMDWARMDRLADQWLPLPRILHPWPEQRFAAITQGRSPVR